MKTDIWFPLYVGDYLKNTRHLTTTEHGAYLLILMDQWVKREGTPERFLKMVAGNPKTWPQIKRTIRPLFEVENGAWTSPRLMKELEKWSKFRDKRRENGTKGGRPKKPIGLPKGLPTDNLDRKPSSSSSSSPSKEKEDLKNKDLSEVKTPDRELEARKRKKAEKEEAERLKQKSIKRMAKVKFEEFRKSYPGTKRGGEVEWEQFQKVKHPMVVVHQLLPALEREKEYHRKCRDTGAFEPQWMNLKTWLNQQGWTKEFGDPTPKNQNPQFLTAGEKQDQAAENIMKSIQENQIARQTEGLEQEEPGPAGLLQG